MERLTNKAIAAAIVFDTVEMATFEQAERVGWEICAAFGVDPDASWTEEDH